MQSLVAAVNRWCGIRPGLRLMATALCRDDQEYERAVTALNSLQTNAAVLEEIRRQGDRQPCTENAKMHQYLVRVGLVEQDLNRLHAIHVAGTKGKGSVCALCESVLRAHGLKTGFYSSPHLLEVRERIRINGRPLSKAAFVSYFWNVFDKLSDSKQSYSNSMPAYFRFLTVMAFTVFLQEKVDVAVVEVGIGGTYDSTNIIPQPVVCAISSLGYDHMDILGTSLSQIAWQKGGICKSGRPALTLPQPPEAMEVLVKRAQELQVSSFQVVPPLSSYPGPQPELSLCGKHQSYNVSLAVQVCKTWLEATGRTKPSTGTPLLEGGVSVAEPFHLPDQFKHGLRHCVWAGRNQVVRRGSMTYYLDGAHTPQSIEASAEWFLTETAPKDTVREPVRILLFNITGRREPQNFLPLLMACQFQYALFCPNVVTAVDSNSADQTNLTVTPDHQMARCYANEKIFQDLLKSNSSSQEETSAVVTKVFPCISHAIQWVESQCVPPPSSHSSTLSHSPSPPSHSPNPHSPSSPSHSTHPHTLSSPSHTPHSHTAILVTGSLHLVGAVMHMLGFTIDDV